MRTRDSAKALVIRVNRYRLTQRSMLLGLNGLGVMVAGLVDAPKVCSNECARRSSCSKRLLICVSLVILKGILDRYKYCGGDIPC